MAVGSLKLWTNPGDIKRGTLGVWKEESIDLLLPVSNTRRSREDKLKRLLRYVTFFNICQD